MPWTEAGFAALPTFDPAWFPRVEPEPSRARAEIPEVRSRRSAVVARVSEALPTFLAIYAAPRRRAYVLGVAASAVWASRWSRATRQKVLGKATGTSFATTAAGKVPVELRRASAQVPRREQAECRR